MSDIDNQIDKLRERLLYLEKQKEEELKKRVDPLETLETIIDQKKKQIENNRYTKSLPLARFYDQEKVGYLEPILNALKNIEERLDILENKKQMQGTLLTNLN
jgi:hypothetical protein